MPWFPEFVSAVELARQQTRAAGQADPVGQYITALNEGDAHALETVWPGEVVIYDPRAGEVRGRRQVRQFVSRNLSWLAGLHAHAETVACTVVGGRAVVELLAYMPHNGRELAWPVAVIAESPDDRSVVFRTYCSQWPLDERRHVRPPILKPGQAYPGDVVGRYQAALDAGDVDAVVSTFAPDGYFRGPFGPDHAHRGAAELRSFYTRCFSAGGGIGLQHCMVTDDGVRCALEYNCVRWAATTCRPRRDSGSTSAARTGCWPRSVYTTTSRHPSGEPGPGQWPAIWPPPMCRISPVMNGAARHDLPSFLGRRRGSADGASPGERCADIAAITPFRAPVINMRLVRRLQAVVKGAGVSRSGGRFLLDVLAQDEDGGSADGPGEVRPGSRVFARQ